MKPFEKQLLDRQQKTQKWMEFTQEQVGRFNSHIPVLQILVIKKGLAFMMNWQQIYLVEKPDGLELRVDIQVDLSLLTKRRKINLKKKLIKHGVPCIGVTNEKIHLIYTR